MKTGKLSTRAATHDIRFFKRHVL